MRTLDIGAVLSFDELVTLRTKGRFEAIAPYLDPFNAKGCTVDYLRDIYRAGLKLAGFFFETTGGSGQGDGYFTQPQGAQDARFAEQLLTAFKREGLVPDGVRVWYTDDVRLRSVSSFDAYANGIEQTATPIQSPGIYGFEDLVRYAQEPVDGRAHRYPNMGLRAFLTYGNPAGLVLDGWQSEQLTIDGITVDASEVYIAGWTAQEEDMTATDLIAAIEADPTLKQRVYDAIAPILQDRIVAPEVNTENAMKALEQTILGNIAKVAADQTGTITDQHIAGVVLATLRGVFDGVAGDMPRPPFIAAPSS